MTQLMTTILLSPEMDYLISQVFQGAAVETLEPIVELLTIQDNIYTMQATLVLRDLQRDVPSVKTYLLNKQEKAEGRAKDRLVMILNG